MSAITPMLLALLAELACSALPSDRGVEATWKYRITFPPPSLAPGVPPTLEGMLAVVARGDAAWLRAEDVGTSHALATPPMELVWMSIDAPVFLRTGIGSSAIVRLQDHGPVDGRIVDAGLLAGVPSLVPPLDILRIAELEALESTGGAVSGATDVRTLRVPEALAGSRIAPLSIEVGSPSGHRDALRALRMRRIGFEAPADGLPAAGGGEVEALRFLAIGDRSIVAEAERRNYAWWPGRTSPDVIRTEYTLDAHAAAPADVDELVDIRSWCVAGVTVVDDREASMGVIGESVVTVRGAQYSLEAPLSAEWVSGGDLLTRHCRAESVTPWGSVGPSGVSPSVSDTAQSSPQGTLMTDAFPRGLWILMVGIMCMAVTWIAWRMAVHRLRADLRRPAVAMAVLLAVGATVWVWRAADLTPRASVVDLGTAAVGDVEVQVIGAASIRHPDGRALGKEVRVTGLVPSCGCLRTGSLDGLSARDGTVLVPLRLSIASLGPQEVHLDVAFSDGATQRMLVRATGIRPEDGAILVSAAPRAMVLRGPSVHRLRAIVQMPPGFDPRGTMPEWILPAGLRMTEGSCTVVRAMRASQADLAILEASVRCGEMAEVSEGVQAELRVGSTVLAAIPMFVAR
jgi:hypothetical protein